MAVQCEISDRNCLKITAITSNVGANCLELESIKSHFFMDVYKICTTSVDLGHGPLRGSGPWTTPVDPTH